MTFRVVVSATLFVRSSTTACSYGATSIFPFQDVVGATLWTFLKSIRSNLPVWS